MDNETRIKQIEKLVSQLSELVDCCEVLTSWLIPSGGTANYYHGEGNWYARRGMAEDFLDKDQANIIFQEMDELDREREDPPNN